MEMILNLEFELVKDTVVPNVWKYIELECGLPEAKVKKVLEKLGINWDRFWNDFDLGGHADATIIEELLNEEYPSNHFILVDFIEENIGYLHVRVWKAILK